MRWGSALPSHTAKPWQLISLHMGLLVPTSKFLFVNLLGDDVTDLGVILGVYLVILLAYFGCYMILCITPK